MTLADLLKQTLDVDCEDIWENERIPTPVRVFGVRLHSMGLSLREVVAVDEKHIHVDGEKMALRRDRYRIFGRRRRLRATR